MDSRTGEPLSSRPEAKFALVAGVAGALAATALSLKAIFASGSSTAALGILILPFVAIAAMVAAGIWGLAAGCAWYSLRGTRRYFRAVLIAAWVAALAGPAVIGWELWRGLALERAVREVAAMDGPALERACEESRWRADRFFLGAVAQHKAAGEALLERIAQLPDPDLWERMGSVWDVMGENRKGLAVMRLVAANPNTGPATLERLAGRPQAEYVLHDVLRNPKTPMTVLERHLDSTNYLIEWGLALNPNLPPAAMARLAGSKDHNTRLNLAWNAATPAPILERLAQDPDESVARNARQALERRAKAAPR
jgi:hypothetical protein